MAGIDQDIRRLRDDGGRDDQAQTVALREEGVAEGRGDGRAWKVTPALGKVFQPRLIAEAGVIRQVEPHHAALPKTEPSEDVAAVPQVSAADAPWVSRPNPREPKVGSERGNR